MRSGIASAREVNAPPRSRKLKAEAWTYSKLKAKEAGGEAFFKERDGKLREHNTYGNDPYLSNG
jgi:hypothetical protein